MNERRGGRRFTYAADRQRLKLRPVPGEFSVAGEERRRGARLKAVKERGKRWQPGPPNAGDQ